MSAHASILRQAAEQGWTWPTHHVIDQDEFEFLNAVSMKLLGKPLATGDNAGLVSALGHIKGMRYQGTRAAPVPTPTRRSAAPGDLPYLGDQS